MAAHERGAQLVTELHRCHHLDVAADVRLERTTGLGVDEYTFQHANANAHRRTQMATTFVDIHPGPLLDVVRGRSGQVVREWVASQPCWWADRINAAAIDAVPWLRHRDR